jgi:hypothetical protein
MRTKCIEPREVNSGESHSGASEPTKDAFAFASVTEAALMGNSGSNQLGSDFFYVIVAIVAFAVVVGISEWLRVRRERDVYRRTQRNASKLIEQQRRRRSAANS